jgi:N-acetylglucosaminyldiphosphoundecaprenol N-acetyl-beta-D-mannosaminyltransferase
MAEHLGRINAPVMIGVGAAFDFLAGTKRQAPLWMQQNGLEWLFRLGSEPGRLWRRYAFIVPAFSVLAVGMLIRHAVRFSGKASSAVAPRKSAQSDG